MHHISRFRVSGLHWLCGLLAAVLFCAQPAIAAPTDILLSRTTIYQTAGANAVVGMLTSADDDTSDHTYTLVAGEGDTDNALFAISESSLLANDSSTLVTGSYSIRIKSDDGNGGTFEKQFTITASDGVFVWSGAGPYREWTIPENWVGNVAPEAGATLIFPADGVTTRESINNLPTGTPINSITIEANFYDIYGEPITLTGGITANWPDGKSWYALDTTLAEPQAINVSGDAELVFNARLGGAQALTKTGTGTLTLFNGADHSYSGTTNVNEGTLLLAARNSAVAVGTALSIAAGATVRFAEPEYAGEIVTDGQIASAVSVTVDEGGTLDLNGRIGTLHNLTLTGGRVITGTGGSLILTGSLTTYASSVSSTIEGPGTLDLNGNTLQISVDHHASLATDLEIGAVIKNGALTKTGAGTLKLSGVNTYGGDTTVSAGTLALSGGDAISANSSVSVASGATLALSSNETIGNLSGAGNIDLGSSVLTTTQTDNTTFSGNISGTGGLTITQHINAGYSLTLSGTNSYSGNTTTTNYGWVRLDGDASVSANSALRIHDSSKVTLLSDQTVGSLSMNTTSATLDLGVGGYTLTAGGNNTSTNALGAIFGSGNLWKQGTGTMIVGSINNTYNGNTIVTGGTLSIASDASLGNGAVILASPDATLAIIGNTTIDNAIAITDTATINVSANATISGIINGDNLIKAGTAKLTLSGNNTYTGTTSVSAGTLSIGASTALGNGNILLASGTTLEATGVTDITNNIVLNGNATLSNSANVTVSGNISGNFNLTKSGNLTLTLSGTNTYAGTIVSAGALSIASDSNLGSGTVSLANTATLSITGNTTIDNAITLTGNATINAAANATISGAINGGFNLTKSGASTLTLTGTNTYTGSTTINGGTLSVAGDANLGVGTINLGAGNSTLAVTNGGTIDNNLSLTGSAALQVVSDLTWSGAISGNNTLNKTGAGTLTLSATNTATGPMTVSAGTLLVTGSVVSATNVSNGATLGGTGTVGNIVTVQNGGTLSPGVSGVNGGIGKLTINGGLDMQSGSILAVQIKGTDTGDDYDQLVVSGAVNISDAILAPIHSYTADNGDEYIIIDNDGVDDISGIFAGLAQSGTITAGGNGAKLTANYTGSDGNDFILIGPINNSPIVNNLSGSMAYSAGDTVLLDSGADVEVSDVEDDADNWNGGSLLIQRTFGSIADSAANDIFGFDAGMSFATDGGNITYGGQRLATFTNGSGVLTISFIGDEIAVNTSMVEQLIRNITYRNDTPYGDATIRFSLTDSGGRTTHSDVTLTCSTIYVNTTNDDIDGDAADGFSLREALDRSLAQASADTIYVVLPDNSTITFGAGVVSGAGDTLNFSSARGLTVTGSTLTLDGALTINTGNSDVTLGSNLVGTATLTKVGTGTLTLTNTDNEASFSGDIALNGGILAVGADDALSSGDLRFDGGTLKVSTGGTVIDNAMSFGNGGGTLHADVDWAASGVFSGSGQFNKTGFFGILTLSGTSGHTGVTSIAEGMLAVGGDENLGTGILELNGGAFSVNTTGKTIDNNIHVTSQSGIIQIDLGIETTLSGLISGTSEILKNGGGKLNLTNSGNSATSWSLRQVNGTTAIASADMIGSGNLRLGGGTLEVNATQDSTFNQAVQVTSATTINADGSNSAVILTFGGAMTGSGALSLNAGDSRIYLTQASGLTGDLTISSSGPDSLVAAINSSTLGTGQITLTNGATLGIAGSARTFTNNIVLAGDATLRTGDSSGGTITFSGVISESGGSRNLTTYAYTSGGGTAIELTGLNTYTGTTTVVGGKLMVASDANLGAGNILLNGGTLNVTGATTIDNAVAVSASSTIQVDAATTLSGIISGGGNLAKTGSESLTLTGIQTHSGNVILSAGTLSVASDANLTSGNIVFNGGTLAVTGATTIDNNIAFNVSRSGTIEANAAATLSGVLSGSGSFIKTGSAELTLTGTQTHSGTTQISAGTLSVASDANLGSGSISLNGGALAISSATTIDNNIILDAVSAIHTPAPVTLSGVISGGADLTKTGSSLLLLTNTNTYSGHLIVSAGELRVTGSTAGAITVSTGSTLSGTGSVGGVTAQNGATLSPGASPGSLTINGNLFLAPGSNLLIEINGTTAGTQYDQIIVNGTATVAGATLVIAHDYPGTPDDIYTIIANDGDDAITGTFTNIEQNSVFLAPGNDTLLKASYLGDSGNDFILGIPTNPNVLDVSATSADGTYKIGDEITLSVTFDIPVVVGTTGGIPTLLLETGTDDRAAVYHSGSGTPTLLFIYTVQPGDNSVDLDYTTSTALALNNGSIRSQADWDAILTLPTPGSTGSLAANKALAIDGIRPTATIVVADTALKIGETSLVTITFNEAVFGFDINDLTVGNGTVSTLSTEDSITWTTTLTPSESVQEATNVITVDNTGVVDAAGNTGAGTSNSNNYAVDTTAPEASSAPDLTAESDSGFSETDNITNVTLPSFIGTAEANASIELFADAISVGTTSVDPSGNWSITLASALAEGTYSFTARVTDNSGNTGPLSAALEVIIDTTAPAAPVLIAISDDTGSSDSDRITSDTTLILSGTGEAGQSVELFRNTTSIGTAPINADGAWSFDYSDTVLAAGSHTFTAKTIDVAGNVSAESATFLVEIDTETPAAPEIVAIANDTGISATDRITNVNTLVFAGVSDPLVTVTLSRNGVGIIGTTTSDAGGVWSFDYSATALADGFHVFTAFAGDTAGNTSATSADFTVTVDTTPPTITAQPQGGTPSINSSFTLSVQAADAHALTYRWHLNGNPLSDSPQHNGTQTTLLTLTAIDPAHAAGDYTVVITDTAGNTTTSAPANIVVLADFPEPQADGYAEHTTGGSRDGVIVTVNTAADFRLYAESPTPAIITVSGILNLDTTPVVINSDKTIQGANAEATLVGNLYVGPGVRNVIIQGLNLTNPGVAAAPLPMNANFIMAAAPAAQGDALTIAGARLVFVTRCTFFDAADHAIQIIDGADEVTLSWNEFYYTSGHTGQRHSVLIGNSSGDATAPRVSIHHNRWSSGVDAHIPLVHQGRVHFYNNVIAFTGNTATTEVGPRAELLSERNLYQGVAAPLTVTSSGNQQGRVFAHENTYVGTTGAAPYTGNDTVFTPPHSYEALPVSDIAVVLEAAGNQSGGDYTAPVTATARISGPDTPIPLLAGFTLTAIPNGFTPISWQWRLNNQSIPGATSATYQVSRAEAKDVGTYTVVLSFASGDVVVSSPLDISVNTQVEPEKFSMRGHGGGGSPSIWFFAAIAMTALLRTIARRRLG